MDLYWEALKWKEIQAELEETKKEYNYDIISPGNKAVPKGDLRVVRVLERDGKLFFALSHESYEL